MIIHHSKAFGEFHRHSPRFETVWRFFCGLFFLFLTSVSAQEVELITTFENELERGITIKLSEELEYEEKLINAPPQIILAFPSATLRGGSYNKQIDLAPLYRIDVTERKIGGLKTEVILQFTSLPEYQVVSEDERTVRVSWKPAPKPGDERVRINHLGPMSATVTLNFRGANLIDILRLLATQNRLNIIAGEEVKGQVTVSLNDVNLGTALDAILKVNGYDWFMQENILVIKPISSEMTGELETRIYKLQYASATSVQTALQNVLSPKGKVQVYSPITGGGGGVGGAGGGAGGGTTAGVGGAGGTGGIGGGTPTHLLVTDVHHNFERIENIIYQLDKSIPQVNIAVKFVETTLGMNERLGIDWSLRSRLLGPATDLADTLGIGLGRWNTLRFATLGFPLFTALLEILASDESTRLLQEPQVTTLDNMFATVNMSTQIPIVVPTIIVAGQAGEIPPPKVEVQDINITLSVLPRINEGRFISMNVVATVQGLAGLGPQNTPLISSRTTTTQVMVADKETLLIGGLIFEQTTETKTSLPFMSKFPFFKKIFSKTDKKSEQRELLIFITPNIVTLL